MILFKLSISNKTFLFVRASMQRILVPGAAAAYLMWLRFCNCKCNWFILLCVFGSMKSCLMVVKEALWVVLDDSPKQLSITNQLYQQFTNVPHEYSSWNHEWPPLIPTTVRNPLKWPSLKLPRAFELIDWRSRNQSFMAYSSKMATSFPVPTTRIREGKIALPAMGVVVNVVAIRLEEKDRDRHVPCFGLSLLHQMLPWPTRQIQSPPT